MRSLVTYEDVSGAGWSSWPTLSVAHIVITPQSDWLGAVTLRSCDYVSSGEEERARPHW
jgi:hypothetical protein